MKMPARVERRLWGLGLMSFCFLTVYVACGDEEGGSEVVESEDDMGSSDDADMGSSDDVDQGSDEEDQGSTDADQGAGVVVTPGTCVAGSEYADYTAQVVDAANDLLEVLTEEQRTAIQYEFSRDNAIVWSNLPIDAVPRNGVSFGEMSEEAQVVAEGLAEIATGETGYRLVEELRAADQALVDDYGGGSGYGEGLYYVAFVGAPSVDSSWMLQIGGHHMAFNLVYNGACAGATPFFDAVEPTSWTDSSGVEHAPLEDQRASMATLFTAIQGLDGVELDGSYNDLLNGPVGGPGGGGPPGSGTTSGSGGDTNYPDGLTYPDSGRGVLVSELTAEQQEMVKDVIDAWVLNAPEAIAQDLLADYKSEESFAQTYVAFSGSADMSTQQSYGRVDGPRVWIEFSVQGGIIIRDKVHFHTIWRDKVSDYGAEFESQ